MTEMPTETFVWAILVSTALLGIIWLLRYNNRRIQSIEERLNVRGHRWRSLRAGCSCWKYETGRSVCSRCVS